MRTVPPDQALGIGVNAGRCRRGGRATAAPAPVRADPRAFTLFEILVVMGLLVLIAGISWPLLQNQIIAAEFPESADRIRDMLFMARAEAAMEHRRFRIRFAPNEQQPHVEFEADPILEPGRWEPVSSAWAREPMLLGDVQVHEIRRGRPIYLTPIAPEEDPEEKAEEAMEEQEANDEAEFDAAAARSGSDTEDDEEVDEDRPLIIFEPDGSTEWATLILAKTPLDEVLEEEHRQLWVVIDGRTGLALIREKVTEAQLADDEFYIQREKLELPEEIDVGSLTLQTGESSGGDSSGGFSSSGFPTGGTPSEGLNALPDSANADLNALSRGDGDAASERTGGRRRRNRGDRSDSGDAERNEESSDREDGRATDLDRQLEDSDLTEEERENIHRTLGGRRGG